MRQGGNNPPQPRSSALFDRKLIHPWPASSNIPHLRLKYWMAPASDTEKVALFRIRGRTPYQSRSSSLYIRPRLHTPSPLDDTMLTRAVLDRALPIQWDICRRRSSRLPPQKRRARCVDIALRTFSQKYCNMVRCECQEKANREGIYMTESMHICWNRRKAHFARNIDTRHFPEGRTGKAIA